MTEFFGHPLNFALLTSVTSPLSQLWTPGLEKAADRGSVRLLNYFKDVVVMTLRELHRAVFSFSASVSMRLPLPHPPTHSHWFINS